MKSFFSRFKDCLNADYGGRYFTAIIEQGILDNPALLKILFPTVDNNIIKRFESECTLRVEYRFPSVTKKSDHRRADLAVLYGGEAIALLEVKYEDEKGKENRYQLTDYLRFAKKDNNLCITYLTQYIPPQKDLEFLKKAGRGNIRHMLYSELYRGINRLNEKGAVARLILEFLEETMGIYKTEINEKALILLVVKGLTLRHQTGFRRLVSDENISDIPDTLSVLIGDLKTLGYRFVSQFGNYFKSRPSITFGFEPEFNYRMLLKDIEDEIEEENDTGGLDPKRKLGGEFYIGFNCKLAQKDPDRWLNLTCGFSFEVEVGKPRLNRYQYTWLGGEHLEDCEMSRKIKSIPQEDVCYQNLLRLIKDVIKESIEKNPSMPSHFKKPLVALRNSIT